MCIRDSLPQLCSCAGPDPRARAPGSLAAVADGRSQRLLGVAHALGFGARLAEAAGGPLPRARPVRRRARPRDGP
eukprot:101260-Prymnesium_polylepis.1